MNMVNEKWIANEYYINEPKNLLPFFKFYFCVAIQAKNVNTIGWN